MKDDAQQTLFSKTYSNQPYQRICGHGACEFAL
jgi:hypothetical protein